MDQPIRRKGPKPGSFDPRRLPPPPDVQELADRYLRKEVSLNGLARELKVVVKVIRRWFTGIGVDIRDRAAGNAVAAVARIKPRHTPAELQCSQCQAMKSAAEFSDCSAYPSGKEHRCRECIRARNRGWWHAKKGTPEGKLYLQMKNFRRVLGEHGMTLEEYEAMHQAQGGVCAICGKPETKIDRHGNVCRLAIDHDHQTGRVRALLCGPCNTGIGMLQEDPVILQKAIDYLRRHARGG